MPHGRFALRHDAGVVPWSSRKGTRDARPKGESGPASMDEALASRYEIVSHLGSGGMGDVYLARDVRLGRDVALKILAPRFANDPMRVARIAREARLLAGLSHPNIATIHGVEESDGTTVLVLEHVEGESLRQRLARGPMPVAEALGACAQVAAGLAAAHDAGVVHRDVKPDNIRIRPDGTVKLLDFGIAKALAPISGDESRKEPTLTGDLTEEAGAVGSPGYLSPEQARGAAIDRRTDTFSFGCVLFEALTGRRAFPGATASDRLAAVLKDEPDFAQLPDGLPQTVRDVLRATLQKDPDRRLRDLVDARLLLLEASAEAPAAAPPVPSASRARRIASGGLAIVLAGALGALAHRALAPAPSRERGTQYLALPRGEPPSLGVGSGLDISADGDRIAYSGATGAVLALDRSGPGSWRLAVGETPFLSPDGQWIGALYREPVKVAAKGGPRVPLGGHVPLAAGGCWLGDDTILYAAGLSGPIMRVPAGGGEHDAVTRLDAARGEVSHRWPHALPDGRAFVYTAKSGTTPHFDEATIRLHVMATGEDRVLMEGGSDARVTTSGHLVFGREGSLFAVAFDDDRLAIDGAPQVVLEGVITTPSTGNAHHAISRNGDLVYLAGDPYNRMSRFTWLDAAGEASESPLRAACHSAVLGPDGKQIAFVQYGANDKIWIADIDDATMHQVTFGPGNDHDLTWSPDGRSLAYFSDRDGDLSIYAVDANGSGGERLLARTSGSAQGGALAAREDGVVFFPSTEQGCEIRLVPWDGSAPPRLLGTRPERIMGSHLSPDGRWLAYTTLAGRLFVEAFPGPGAKVYVGEGKVGRWADGGRMLVQRLAPDGGIVASSFEPGPIPVVSEGRTISRRSDLAFSGSRGDRLLFMTTDPDAVPEVRLVTGFFAVLEREVPTR